MTNHSSDNSISETSLSDTSISDTSISDTSLCDTNINDTSISDTSLSSTSIGDTCPNDNILVQTVHISFLECPAIVRRRRMGRKTMFDNDILTKYNSLSMQRQRMKQSYSVAGTRRTSGYIHAMHIISSSGCEICIHDSTYNTGATYSQALCCGIC